MGLMHVFGVPKTVLVNVTLAQEYFALARDMGNMDAYYNLAMLHLGWMNPDYGESMTKTWRKKESKNSPTKKDFRTAVTYLDRASKRGHYQAKYRLAQIYARGISLKRTDGVFHAQEKVVQSSCPAALKLYREIADTGTTVSKRMRVAYKQYTLADYDSSLRNYMAAAEGGSMDAQVNAAFLLEQGHCLGMNGSSCLKACLRVGDFYYYNRVDGGTESRTGTERTNRYSIATSPYTRYILYPEDLFQLVSVSVIAGIKSLFATTQPTQ